jgi:hypothetical protein
VRILHAVWGVLSIALAVGVNRYMAPRVERGRDATELATPAGVLHLDVLGASRDIPLVTLRPLVEDIAYPFGKRIEIRELTLRSVGATADPELELFFDLTKAGVGAASRDPSPWRGQRLPVLPVAFGGAPRSRVRAAGRTDPLGVVEGTLTFDTVAPLGESASGMQRWSARGELLLTLVDGGELQQARGQVEAVVTW